MPNSLPFVSERPPVSAMGRQSQIKTIGSGMKYPRFSCETHAAISKVPLSPSRDFLRFRCVRHLSSAVSSCEPGRKPHLWISSDSVRLGEINPGHLFKTCSIYAALRRDLARRSSCLARLRDNV